MNNEMTTAISFVLMGIGIYGIGIGLTINYYQRSKK